MHYFLILITIVFLWIEVYSDSDSDSVSLDEVLQVLNQYDSNETLGRQDQPPIERPKTIIPKDWHTLNDKDDTTVLLGPTPRYVALADNNKGYIKFVPKCENDSEEKTCILNLKGTRTFRCQVSVVCDKPLDFDGQPCDQAYLELNDGAQGRSKFCNGFDFKRQSYKARQLGRDLQVVVKGQSKETVCFAFCREDLARSKNISHGILFPTVITKIKGELGYKENKSCVCGIRKDQGNLSSRIIGGKDAIKFEFPWLAGIVLSVHYSVARVQLCGAVLISDMHLVTAAHCFDSRFGTKPKNYQVILHVHVMDKTPSDGTWTDKDASGNPGWNLPTETDESEGTIRADIEKIYRHELYSTRYRWSYDIAIITLKKRLDLSTGYIAPICLQRITELLTLKPKTNLTVAGWGHAKWSANAEQKGNTRLLQQTDVPFVDHINCFLLNFAHHSLLCAGNLAHGGIDACYGDSGGPLIYKMNEEKNQYMLVGVVSHGRGCARRLRPGAYTDTQELLSWIIFQTYWNSNATWCSR